MASPLVRQPNRPGPRVAMRQEWTKWHEVSIKLEGVPRGTTTLDVFRSMQAYGRIDSITIPQIRDPRSVNHAYVSFSPAPSNAFWTSGTIALTVRGESRRVRIDLQSPRRPRMISSPLRPEVKYPERSLFRLKSLDFGIMSQERAMDIMKTIEDPVYYPTMTVNLRHKKIELQFSCSIDDPRREDPNIHRVAEPVGMREKPLYPPEFRADIQFRHVEEVFSVEVDQDHWCLLISQKHPPKFWKRRRDTDKSHQKEGTRWGDLDTWIRTTEISYADWAKKYPVTTYEPFQFLEIGKWTTYRLFFRKSDTSHWGPVKDALGDFNIQIIPTNTQTVTWKQGLPSTFRKFIDDPIVMDANDHLSLLHSTDKIALSYDVRYQLEAAISHGIFTEQSITPDFLRQLSEIDTQKDHDDKRASLVNRAKNILEYVTEADRPVYDPMALFKNRFALTHHTSIALPEHCTWVRKLIVTPSKVYLSSPCPETTNRVLRHYNNERDRFLRVQFTDERTDGKIHAHPDSDVSDSLFSRVYRALRQGIRIGDRHFHFLAFGNSQFREHGAYFFCPTATISCDDIRDWMGDFSHIDVVAKYASRLGQCFSTTRDPRGVGVGLLVKQIPDIEENGWCFTDGVGIISTWLAHEITRKLKLYQNGKVPSAFQFRHGGNKGILVNWPQANFNEIYIRPSQQKFTSRAKSLEIIRASRFSVATLNRQTISILSCLGVPDDVFIALTKNQLFDYSTAMTDPQVAIKLLGQFVDENGMTTTIAQMVKDGFMQSEEPFTKALLQLWRAWSMKLLREKARIVVENGVFVFGCIDETRTLRGQRNVNEGNPTKDRSKLPQIFLQVSRPDQPDSYQVIKGLCVVGRNPSLHPGDLRVVEAVDVDVPALKTLRNVVVFPADGDRDVASMCSGGDLDGDDYFVFWDPALLPEEWNHPPMMHDAVIPKKADGKITINNISRFFVEYLKNDSLSTIALAHVVWSDKCAEGPKSSQCLELAKLHSNAVDYIKTGQSARMSPGLHPKLWPHFMERMPEKSYRSEKILGKLYDLVAKVDFAPDFECTFDSRILRRYTISDDLLKSARGVKTQYDIAMRRIMNQREIGTEFEVWSTFVMSKPRVGSDYKVQEELGLVMMGLRDRFTQACIGQAEAEDPETQEIDRAKLYPFIAAMYHVTWEEVQIVLQEWQETRVIGGRLVPKRRKDQTPFISFPWLFEADLGRIATSATAEATESEPLPSVPKIVQATSIEEAMGCVAACVEDGRLFHRGEEIFMTTLDVEPMADEDPISSGSSSNDLATTEAVVEEVEKEEDVEMEVEVEIEDVQVTSGLERLGLDSGN
ncbi:putative RNA dependent RNA polymerase-domain-containing protein [Seiridium cardinale]|uniref:RNA-dependent RNA polymerase n=1 Tax=Seiridium cardinale TaxID=138064 RepID=A0ABR2XMZ8_9PEZI